METDLAWWRCCCSDGSGWFARALSFSRLSIAMAERIGDGRRRTGGGCECFLLLGFCLFLFPFLLRLLLLLLLLLLPLLLLLLLLDEVERRASSEISVRSKGTYQTHEKHIYCTLADADAVLTQ